MFDNCHDIAFSQLSFNVKGKFEFSKFNNRNILKILFQLFSFTSKIQNDS